MDLNQLFHVVVYTIKDDMNSKEKKAFNLDRDADGPSLIWTLVCVGVHQIMNKEGTD
jgi:hypothetical protein